MSCHLRGSPLIGRSSFGKYGSGSAAASERFIRIADHRGAFSPTFPLTAFCDICRTSAHGNAAMQHISRSTVGSGPPAPLQLRSTVACCDLVERLRWARRDMLRHSNRQVGALSLAAGHDRRGRPIAVLHQVTSLRRSGDILDPMIAE
ncbi:hypothetical protein JCM7686_0288 [Paracoccus aminophilus JCM 7686]|uniref:Uncharacterized protein n=1 Tax=Paracoccus aminophilus JCM 7686 TaxID=1367847 RepID=S5XJN4_PARAH|nr:hypothetical protein JCM7686_0288 [Paracoccus aminophilus JCM 7686]